MRHVAALAARPCQLSSSGASWVPDYFNTCGAELTCSNRGEEAFLRCSAQAWRRLIDMPPLWQLQP